MVRHEAGEDGEDEGVKVRLGEARLRVQQFIDVLVVRLAYLKQITTSL